MDKKKVIGISIFIFLILLIVGINTLSNDKGFTNLKTVYVATGGGKEDFLADEEVLKILKKKYKLNVIFDTWSNGKTITKPLIRESVNLGNESIIKRIQNNEDISINTSGVSKYDALFTSDQRFYDYYKLVPNKENNEADRYTVIAGSLTLNTPIVIYSWKEVVNAFINEGIVTLEDNVYYITDMNKLIDYILNNKKWSDVGLNELYGNINIASTHPLREQLIMVYFYQY